ncbi:MAG: DoxX family protein [Dehalococcoidia bacterium]
MTSPNLELEYRSRLASESAAFRVAAPATPASRPAGAARKKNIALWTTQGVLAALFLFAGVSKLVMPAADVQAQTDLPVWFLRFIGGCETLGAIGLVLPWLLRIRRELTPLAAAGLVIIMCGATVVTVAAGDGAVAVVPFAVGVLAASVAVGRGRAALQ